MSSSRIGASEVSVLDHQSLQFGPAVTVQPNPHGVAFAPSMNRAYTANHESNSVSVIDLASTTAVGKSLRYVAASPDGRSIYVSNGEDGTVSVLDASA
jgi:DNA-binding beta-propeller fold protein YncE